MIDQAIAHITEQMMKLNQPLVQMIEEHLTTICTTNAVAEKLLNKEKTLKELSDQIWKEAEKRKKGNGAFIPDKEISEIAENYFGITEQDKAGNKVIDIRDLL